jgi:hypothetical protein
VEEKQKKMSPEYTAAREKLSELAAAAIAAGNEFGLTSQEYVSAYNAYEEQLKFFDIFNWL